MRLIFLGSGEFAQPTLRWLVGSGHEVLRVITQPARGSGRGRRVTRTPVQALAEELGLPVTAVEDVNAPEVVADLRSLRAALGVVIAFGQKIGQELRDVLPGGFINLHASLLPKYRGAAPINWAIINGEQLTGCTVFRIVERMDAGAILAQDSTEIKPLETAGELHDRLAEIGVSTVQKALAQFSSENAPDGMPQDEREASKAPKLKKSDGFVHFDLEAEEIAARIHGVTPWPGAAARFEARDGRWEDVVFLRVRPVNESSQSLEPGRLDSRLWIASAAGVLEPLEIKPSSGRQMNWRDYVNGRRVSPGDRFVSLEEGGTEAQ